LVHELGHLLTARHYGIKVLALPVFGPELISFIDRFGTAWKLGAFPKTIEKTILRILGSCTFLHSQGQSLQKRGVRTTSGLPPIATVLTSRWRFNFISGLANP
jgi:hypothetical protein